jgi:hypothetical protein
MTICRILGEIQRSQVDNIDGKLSGKRYDARVSTGCEV